MVGRLKILALVLLSGGMVAIGLSPELRAATSSTDILSDDRPGGGPDSVDVGAVKPLAKPSREPARTPTGNPLWSVPLSALPATQERPIFSASRRPPQRAVVAPAAQAVAPPQPPAAPDRPALALIGAVVGDGDAIAVFLDRSNQKIFRLRQGDSHAGWQLSSVQAREVTLKKADRSEVLALQRPEGPVGAPGGIPGMPGGIPGMPVPQPVAGATDGSFAPFTPRSTPKNGESDGL
jgi:general secretion pathway protein N